MASEIHTSFEEAFEKIQPNSSSYLVIVTRGHKDDMRVLAWAVGTDARYIGMIGSKRKVLSVYKALEKEGFAPEKFERVHAPVGLDIGALTPEEIAVSIAAELIAVRRNAPNLPHKSVKLSEAARLLQRLTPMLAAAILAAGESRRMGSPESAGSVSRRHFRRSISSRRRAIRAWASRGSCWVRARKKFARSSTSILRSIVVNPNWEKGQLSSIHAAIRSLPPAKPRE